MADVPKEVCAFCGEGDKAGNLRNTSKKNTLAHFNCLLFSPEVITRSSQDSQDNETRFDISSVKKEIKRGKKLICSYEPCKRKGATIGCDIKRCKKTYHYNCVIKAGGEHIRDYVNEKYIVYCFKHKLSGNNDDGQNNETSVTSMSSSCSHKSNENQTPKKRKRKTKHTVRKKIKFDRQKGPGTVENVEEGAQRPSCQLPDNHTNEEDTEAPGTSGCQENVFYIQSDSEEETDNSHSSQRNEQNAGMSAERNHAYREAPGSGTSLLHHDLLTITLSSCSESEDDLPAFNGSQLVNIKNESCSTTDDALTPVNKSTDFLSSTPRERSASSSSGSSTDCGDPSGPKISNSFSLSGFPKKNKGSRRRNNPGLDNVLSEMNPEEKADLSQLYDDIGGSFPMYEDNLISNEYNDEQSATDEPSGEGNPNIESPALIQTPEGQLANCAHVEETISTLQLPRPSPGSTNISSEQPVSITNKVTNADCVIGTTLHQADDNSREELASTSGELLTSAQPEDSTDGENDARPRHKDISIIKETLDGPSSAVCPNTTDPCDDHSLSSDTNKSSNKVPTINSLNLSNILNEQNTIGSKTKILKTPSQSKAHLSAPSNGTSIERMAARPPRANMIVLLRKKLMDQASTTREEAICPDTRGNKESEVQNETCHPSPQTLKLLSDNLKQGAYHNQFSHILPQIQRNFMTPLSSSQRSNDCMVSEPAPDPSIALQPQTQNYISHNTEEDELVVVEKEITHPKEDSGLLFEDEPPSAADTEDNELVSVEVKRHPGKDPASLSVDTGQTGDEAPSSKHTEEDKPEKITHPEEDAAPFSGQTEDEAPSARHTKEDEPVVVEDEITHPEVDLTCLSDEVTFSGLQKGVEEEMDSYEDPALPSDTGQEEDEAPSVSYTEEDEPVVVEEEITHPEEDLTFLSDATNTAVLAPKSSQTEISTGFPANINQLHELESDQKIQLIECYQETERQISETSGMEAGAAKAFWDLCKKNKCREFLLTLVKCCCKSVIHKIVHEEPEDRDFEQAFAFLRTSGCFEDFINNRIKDVLKVNAESSKTSSLSISNKDNENPGDGDRRNVQSESSESSSELSMTEESSRDKCFVRMQNCLLKSSSESTEESNGNQHHDKKQNDLLKSSSEKSRTEESARGEQHDRMQNDFPKSFSEESMMKESARGEHHDRMQNDLIKSSTERSRTEESARGENHDKMQNDVIKSSTERSRTEESARGEHHDRMQNDLPKSFSEESRTEESARGEHHDKMQNDLPKSSLEKSRTEESARGEHHDRMQNDLPKSFSKESMMKESARGEYHDKMQNYSIKSSTERSRTEESARGEHHDKMQNDLPKSSSEERGTEGNTRGEHHDRMQNDLIKSSTERNRREESSRGEHYDTMQNDFLKSSSERSRTEGNTRDKRHNRKQKSLPKSSSERSRNKERSRHKCHDRKQIDLPNFRPEITRKEESTTDEDAMETESPELALFTSSVSSDSDLPESTCIECMSTEKCDIKILKTLQVISEQQQIMLYQLQKQAEDRDACFAASLVTHLRKVPEDKILQTQQAILNILSVTSQPPTSTLNPACVSQHCTNTSTTKL